MMTGFMTVLMSARFLFDSITISIALKLSRLTFGMVKGISFPFDISFSKAFIEG